MVLRALLAVGLLVAAVVLVRRVLRGNAPSSRSYAPLVVLLAAVGSVLHTEEVREGGPLLYDQAFTFEVDDGNIPVMTTAPPTTTG